MEMVNLSDGNKMPMIGLGTYLSKNEEELIEALNHALEAGYRHFDTAYLYENEKILGKVFKNWFDTGKATREELFVVTKLPLFGNNKETAGHFLQKSLDNLQLKYVDLYLIHHPFALKYSEANDLYEIENGQPILDYSTSLEELWKVMEGFVKQGKTKSIGISNFDENQIDRIVKVADIKPSCLQLEVHAYLQESSLRALCAKHGMVVCAYSPLGSPGHTEFCYKAGINYKPIGILENLTVTKIASLYGKSPAQILLRFLVQQGVVVIPKSTNAKRLKENIEILDFKLSSMDMKELESLDKGEAERVFTFAEIWSGIEKHSEFPENLRRTLHLRQKNQ